MGHYQDNYNEDLIALNKAMTYTDQGSALLETIVDSQVSRLMDFENPLRRYLTREQQEGGHEKRILRRRNAPTAGEFIAEDGSFTTYVGTYDQMLFPFKIIGTKVRIYDFLKSTSKNLLNVVTEELGARMEELRDYEDLNFVRGVCSSTAFEGVDTLITTNQSVATTTASGGGALTLAKLDEAIDKALTNETDMFMIASRRSKRALNALLQPYQQFVNVTPLQVPGGFRVPTYQGIPIFTSTNIPDTQTFNGSTNTSQTGSNCSEILILSKSNVKICELTSESKFMSFGKLAQLTFMWDDYEIKGYEVLFVKNPLKISKLWGINA